MKRKIAVITGTRADYGIYRPLLKAIKRSNNLKLNLIVTCMHLSNEFGNTVKEIEKDGFKISSKVDMLLSSDTGESMAKSIGIGIIGFAQAFESLKPDIILLLGDRGEMLAGAIAGSYMNIPIAHLHGGELSGSVDGLVRHSITKLSHIHFPATKESANRILKMGEENSRIFCVGALGLDSILNAKFDSKECLSKNLEIDFSKRLILVVQHPVTTQIDKAKEQIKITLDVVSEIKEQTILIYPNADAGGREMINMIHQYEGKPFLKTYKSLPHSTYLGLLKNCSVLIGNSSSGIIEAPSFKIPVVNIGIRQQGRERSTNVIDVDHNKEQILSAVRKALYDEDFKRQVKNCKNLYGDGHASERIVKILSKIKIDKKLLQKQITY